LAALLIKAIRAPILSQNIFVPIPIADVKQYIPKRIGTTIRDLKFPRSNPSELCTAPADCEFTGLSY